MPTGLYAGCIRDLETWGGGGVLWVYVLEERYGSLGDEGEHMAAAILGVCWASVGVCWVS